MWEYFTTNGNQWVQFGTASATVSPGAINQLAWYSASGSIVSGFPTTANGLLTTNGSSVPTWSTYQQGTWTPIDSSGAGLSLTAAGSYTQIGDVVIAWCNITYPATANGSNAIIGGLPVSGGGNTKNGANVVFSNVATLRYALMNGGGSAGTTVNLYNSSGVAITNAAMSAATLYLQFTYGI